MTVAAPRSLELAFAARLLEAMFVGLPEGEGALTTESLEDAVKAIHRADAVVVGPGIGRTPDAQALVRALVERVDVPLVLDADGLNAMAGRLEDLRQRRWPTILTPHAGELGRLLEVDSQAVAARRLHHAAAASARSKALVVLKGDDTLVAAPAGRVAVSRGGAPALATAGTGDVLSGVVAAMLAKGLRAPHAACAGVYAHLRAGPARGRAARARRGHRVGRDRRAARGARRVGSLPLMPLSVGDIMDPDPVTVFPEDTVEAVLRTLRENELPGVPVINSGGRCVGIITEADLVLAGENEDLHLPHYFELFGGFVFLEPLSHFEDRLRKATAALARDLMTEDPVTMEPTDSVEAAARLISRSKHNRLPVVEHGRLVGVITRVDVLEALTRD